MKFLLFLYLFTVKVVFAQTLPSFFDDNSYIGYDEMTRRLEEMAKVNSDIVELTSIGKTVENREIWVVKISDNVSQDELEPEFKYIANMHGDEIVGREMLLRFIEDLIQTYKKADEEKDEFDQKVTSFINNTEIFLIPSMNPDGAEGGLTGTFHLPSRVNADGLDLNRDFDLYETENVAPETKAVMDFLKSRNFALSANFHGGALVVNYPWDGIRAVHPQTDLLIELSEVYRDSHREMSEFPENCLTENCLTNGYKWYPVEDGMPDWSMLKTNDLELTIELGLEKWPDFVEISKIYEDNRLALFEYGFKIHQGVGIKIPGDFDDSDLSMVTVKKILLENGNSRVLKTYSFKAKGNEFYHVFEKGTYQINIENREGEVTFKTVEVTDSIGAKFLAN
jgi:hypothetical protein